MKYRVGKKLNIEQEKKLNIQRRKKIFNWAFIVKKLIFFNKYYLVFVQIIFFLLLRRMHYEIRPGVRGGRDQFKWDDLKNMKYQDREQYLGFSAKIGYLDKGGKWKKKDWYIKNKSGDPANDKELQEEIRRVQEEDNRRMRIRLGLEKPAEEMKNLSGAELEEFQKQMELQNELEKQNREYQGLEEDNDYQGLGTNNEDKNVQKKNIQKLMEGKAIAENVHRLDGEGIVEDK